MISTGAPTTGKKAAPAAQPLEPDDAPAPDIYGTAAEQELTDFVDAMAADIFGLPRLNELQRVGYEAARIGATPRMAIEAAAYAHRTSMIGPLPMSVIEGQATAGYRAFQDGKPLRPWRDGDALPEGYRSPHEEAREAQLKAELLVARKAAHHGETGKPRIILAPELLVENTDQAEAAMLQDSANEPVFAHAGAWATVRKARPITPRGVREEQPAVIHHYDAPALRERMMRAANFYVVKRAPRQATPTEPKPKTKAKEPARKTSK
jgi:hypothetical protein